MEKDGLASTLKGLLILHGMEVILGNTAFRTWVSEYFSNISVLEIEEEVLPITIRSYIEGLEGKVGGDY